MKFRAIGGILLSILFCGTIARATACQLDSECSSQEYCDSPSATCRALLCEENINCFTGSRCCGNTLGQSPSGVITNGRCQSDCSQTISQAPSADPAPQSCADLGGGGIFGDACQLCNPACSGSCTQGVWDCFTCRVAVPSCPLQAVSLSLSEPQEGQIFPNGSSIHIVTQLVDPDGQAKSVSINQGGVSLCDGPLPQCLDFQWSGASSGTYQIGARAFGAAGNLLADSGNALTVTITPDKTPVYRPAATAPTLSSLSPSNARVGSGAFTLNVMGANFLPTSIVRWNGTDRPTLYVDPGTLQASISADDLSTRGFVPVTVFNPGAGGSLSGPLTFAVRLAPTLDSISPSAAPIGSGDVVLTVLGSNFVPEATVQWNGVDKPTTFLDSGRLTAIIPAADLAVSGSYFVTVFNPAPGGPSLPKTFTVVQAASASCGTSTNPIVAENCKPGSPSSEWEVPAPLDTSIQGFTTDISWNKGDTVLFKIKTDASSYHIDIYRMGYYGGLGARKVASISPAATLPQTQPDCLRDDATTGLIDCGNWSESASWAIPGDAVSGLYFAKLIRDDNARSSHVPFIVRDDASRSAILFQTSDTTWAAYNAYGGNSLYVGKPAGRAFKVSYNRPFIDRPTYAFIFDHEYPMIRWLESNGYDVSYLSGVDSDRRGAGIRNHRVFLSVGHDEYWSGAQRSNVEDARASGVHLAFFSGNSIYWKTRWENSADGTDTPYRTLVCYKETYGGIDPLNPPIWTGAWRDPKNSPPSDGGRPENALTGLLWSVDSFRSDPLAVPAELGKLRLWRNTSVATLDPNTTAVFPGLLGYEWDEDSDNGARPAGLFQLSASTINVPRHTTDFGVTFQPAAVTHHLTLYRSASGALVFGAGTMQWSWGLDNTHDNGTRTAADSRIQQATINLLTDMGVAPATPQAGYVVDSPSADRQSPVSSVTSPTADATISLSAPTSIQGTATDVGGGVVGGVEVSVDGGASWHFALGRENWRYDWTPSATGSITILSRAVDDSGNLETNPLARAVTVTGVVSNLAPTLSALAPSNSVVGGPDFTLTVTGNGFANGSSVQWNGQARPTTYVSESQLTAVIPSSDLQNRAFVPVTVFTPAPGGGTSSSKTFTVRLVPQITALDPSAVLAGGPSFTLTVTGQHFVSDAVVQWNGSDRPTTFVSDTQLSASIPAADIAVVGSANITVFNPAPGGPSGPQTFTISNSASVGHGAASLSGVGVVGEFRDVLVYPNPWRADVHKNPLILFQNLPTGSTVDLFTLSGHWIRQLDVVSGLAQWDLRNDQGERAASGFYSYLIRASNKRTSQGLVGVVR